MQGGEGGSKDWSKSIKGGGGPPPDETPPLVNFDQFLIDKRLKSLKMNPPQSIEILINENFSWDPMISLSWLSTRTVNIDHETSFHTNLNISQPKYWGVSTACFLYPQDFGVGSPKNLQHPKWWVHGNSTIQLKQIIRYGIVWTSRSKQPLCDLCATTTSALKVGVMTVHNIIT